MQPTDPGGWGPLFLASADGALTTSLSILPWSGAEHTVDVRFMLGHGAEVSWSEGPLESADGAAMPWVLAPPAEVSFTLAQVTILVTASDPADGRAIGRAAARAFVVREADGLVSLLTEEEATLVVVPLADAISTADGTVVVDDLVGREVTL